MSADIVSLAAFRARRRGAGPRSRLGWLASVAFLFFGLCCSFALAGIALGELALSVLR